MGLTVIGIGELLWDLFPQGRQLGGAPANFVYHCQQLGIESYPISCVGGDQLGREILDALGQKNLDTSYVAVDPVHPTGTVSVELDDDGKPEYIIHEGVAWDYIPLTETMITLAQKADAVCFGSLAQRAAASREAIQKLLQATRPECIKIFDINLRQHYYSADLIETMLEISTVLKLSDEELPVVASMLGFSGSEKTLLEQIATRFTLDLVALTKGPDGSCLYQKGRYSEHPGYEAKVVDTVGAGDSFTAVLAAGLLRNEDLETINDSANQTAAYVCSQSGAMPEKEDGLANCTKTDISRE